MKTERDRADLDMVFVSQEMGLNGPAINLEHAERLLGTDEPPIVVKAQECLPVPYQKPRYRDVISRIIPERHEILIEPEREVFRHFKENRNIVFGIGSRRSGSGCSGRRGS